MIPAPFQYHKPASVAEAAEHLAAQGAELCPWVPPDIPEALDIYYQLVGADGGMDVTRLLKNSQVHPHLKRLVQGPVSPGNNPLSP